MGPEIRSTVLSTLAWAVAESGRVRHCRPTLFLKTFLDAYVAARNDRAQRVRILKSIMDAVETNSDIDSA